MDSFSEKVKSVLKKILEYAVFWLLGYIIGRFIKIPIAVSIIILIILGGLSIKINVDPEKSDVIKKIPVIKDYFRLMYKANKKIGQSVQDGSWKGSFKFAFGILNISLYYFVINLFIITIKAIVFLTTSPDGTFSWNFMQAFSLLFGAGVVAYIVWMKNLANEVANQKAQMKNRQKMDVFKTVLSRWVKIWALFYAYLIWILGEIIFLAYSPGYKIWILWFAYFGVTFFLIMVFILIFSRIYTPAKPQGQILKDEKEKKDVSDNETN